MQEQKQQLIKPRESFTIFIYGLRKDGVLEKPRENYGPFVQRKLREVLVDEIASTPPKTKVWLEAKYPLLACEGKTLMEMAADKIMFSQTELFEFLSADVRNAIYKGANEKVSAVISSSPGADGVHFLEPNYLQYMSRPGNEDATLLLAALQYDHDLLDPRNQHFFQIAVGETLGEWMLRGGNDRLVKLTNPHTKLILEKAIETLQDASSGIFEKLAGKIESIVRSVIYASMPSEILPAKA